MAPTSHARPFLERFMEKIKVDPSTGCWQWQARIDEYGYGEFSISRGRHASASRVAYVLFVGPVPPGYHVDHLCRNRSCANPAHLEAVTAGENARRGRGVGALNALKTHCPRGHAYDRVTAQGRRTCSICALEASRRHRQRKKSGVTK